MQAVRSKDSGLPGDRLRSCKTLAGRGSDHKVCGLIVACSRALVRGKMPQPNARRRCPQRKSSRCLSRKVLARAGLSDIVRVARILSPEQESGLEAHHAEKSCRACYAGRCQGCLSAAARLLKCLLCANMFWKGPDAGRKARTDLGPPRSTINEALVEE
jgi:hypothetical protein